MCTKSPMPTEEWKPVNGYEGVYEISNLGRLKRVGKAPGARVGHILATVLDGHGYAKNVLYRDGIGHPFSIHALVAAAFIGPRPEGYDINHLDGNPLNNVVTNLEYATRSDNNIHSYRILHRTHEGMKGSRNGGAKLAENQVRKIHRLFATGRYTQSELGRMFNVTHSTVHQIVHGRAWKHLNLSPL